MKANETELLHRVPEALTVHTVFIGDAADSTFVTCHLCEKELERIPKGGDVEALTVPGTYADLGQNYKGKERWESVGKPVSPDMKMCTPPQG
jgi:hypothetical protein